MSNSGDGVPDSIAEADRFQRLFVAPAVEAMGAKMEAHLAPLVEAQKTLLIIQSKHGERLDKLEGGQRKALVGYGVFAAGLSVALAAGWDFLKRKVGWK